jgi:hypothetical protein
MVRSFWFLCLLFAPITAERDRAFAGELDLDVDELHQVAAFKDHLIKANATLNTSSSDVRDAIRFLAHVMRLLKSESAHRKMNGAGAWHLTTVILMQQPYRRDEVVLDILGFTGLVSPILLGACALGEMHDNIQDGDWCRFGVNGVHFFMQMGSLGSAVTANICGLPIVAQVVVSGTQLAWGLVYDYLRNQCGSNDLREQRKPLLDTDARSDRCEQIDVGRRKGWNLDELIGQGATAVDVETLDEYLDKEIFNPLHIQGCD